jgi:molecular chaperone HtpG
MLSETDFYDRAKKFSLFKDTDGKYFTYDEYKTLIKDNQTGKDDTLVYLYSTDKEGQYSYIESAKSKGYSVLMLNGQLDSAMLGLYEQKFEKSRFVRVDSDVIDRLIVKSDDSSSNLESSKKELIESVFSTQLPKLDKSEFHVESQGLGESGMPLVITQSEYMRRMKDMSRLQPGMSFYGEMPDMLNVVVNTDHKLVKDILSKTDSATAEALKPVNGELAGLNARHDSLNAQTKDKKWDEVDQSVKDDLSATEKKIEEEKGKKTSIIAESAKDNAVVHQLIDLALLQNGMLRGESLARFVKRSIELI